MRRGAAALLTVALALGTAAADDAAVPPQAPRRVAGRISFAADVPAADRAGGLADISCRARAQSLPEAMPPWEAETVTDAAGAFAFERVPAHIRSVRVEVEADLERWCALDDAVVDVGDASVELVLRLAGVARGRIDGRALSPASTLSQGTVRAQWERRGLDDMGTAVGRVAADGSFEIQSIPRDLDVTVSLETPPKVVPPFFSAPLLARAGRADLVLTADPGRTLRGRLIPNGQGVEVARSIVALQRDGPVCLVSNPSRIAVADPYGRFVFEGLGHGPHRIHVTGARAELLALGHRVGPEDTDVDVRCGFDGAFEVTVEVHGEPGERFTLDRWVGMIAVAPPKRAVVPAEGPWIGDVVLPTGSLRYALLARGSGGRIACVRVHRGEPARAKLVLAPGATLRGRLHRGDFARRVLVADVAGFTVGTSAFTRQGAFEVLGLPAGKAEITVCVLRPHATGDAVWRPRTHFVERRHGPFAVGAEDVVLEDAPR